MSGSLIPNAKQQFLDANGNPLAGGFVYYYIPSTTTFKNTYQNAALTILNTNPIVLDSAGECIAYGAGSYRQIVTDVNGNLIWDQPTLSVLTNDATNVIYTAPFTGSVAQTVSTKLSESVSVKDFGAKGDGSTDDTAAIQAALDSFTNGGILYFPPGTYMVSKGASAYALTPKSKTTLYGVRTASVIKLKTASTDCSIFGSASSLTELTFEGLTLDGNSSVLSAILSNGLNFPYVGTLTSYDCTFQSFTNNGILVGQTTRCDWLVVEKCAFQSIKVNGIVHYNTRKLFVNDCRFFDFVTSAIDGNYLTTYNEETTVTVTNNYFKNDSVNWLFGNSTISLLGDRNYCANNVIIGGGSLNVHSTSARSPLRDYRIIGNSVQDTVTAAIIVNTDVNADIIVANNYIRNSSKSGIYVVSIAVPPYTNTYPTTITGNIIEDASNETYTNTNQPSCIRLAQTTNVLVSNNQCITPRWAGISVQAGSNNINIQNNSIIGQQGIAPTDLATNAGGGIVVQPGGAAYVANVTNIFIDGNFIYNYLTSQSPTTNIRTGGIVAYNDSSGANTVDNITITNNMVRLGNGIGIQTYFLGVSKIDGNTISQTNGGTIVDTSSVGLAVNSTNGFYSAAPTTGTWTRGTIIYNSVPASAGYVGWVCTASGTPGTWNTFGLIS